jgi:hypothetical protein
MKTSILAAAMVVCTLSAPNVLAQEIYAPAGPMMGGPQGGPGMMGGPQGDPRMMGGPQGGPGMMGGRQGGPGMMGGPQGGPMYQ